MKLPFKKTFIQGWLVLGIGLSLTLAFTLNHLGSLTEQDEMIDEIYKNQLDALLFSVNQYSTDVISNWAESVSSALKNSDDNIRNEIGELVQHNQSVEGIFFEFIQDGVPSYVFSSTDSDHQRSICKTLINQEPNKKDKLYRYFQQGYQKLVPLSDSTQHEFTYCLFVAEDEIDNPVSVIMVIDPVFFIQEMLTPKIMEIGEEKFFIAIFDPGHNNIISSNLLDTLGYEIQQFKDLWLLPGYSMGIDLVGLSLSDLIEHRTKRNLIILVVFNVVMILLIWFTYKSVRRATELARIKSEFVSNVSHEIRTPLTMISMYTEMLLMKRVANEAKRDEYYDIIYSETNRLTNIVHNILNFSRIEKNKHSYEFTLGNLNEVMKRVIKTCQHRLQSNGFSTTQKLQDDLPDTNFDFEAILDAVINLVDNAIKYSGSRKELVLSTFRQGKSLVVEVKDHGIGIDEKDKNLIFEKFYRVTSGDLAHKAKGSGLGLSIVKHIMTAHGGHVAVESKPGYGSTFRMIFPIT